MPAKPINTLITITITILPFGCHNYLFTADPQD